MTPTSDVLIIGGGVIGLAIARALARDGLRVTVFERNAQPGGEASWAAAGMLAPQAEADAPGPLFDLCLRSRALYPAFVAALWEETRIDAELCPAGTLLLAEEEHEVAALQAKLAWQTAAGCHAEWLSPEDVQALEPLLKSVGALYLPDDWQVENRRLTQALIASATAAQVRIVCQCEGIALLVEHGRVAGVEMRDERWSAPVVVNAAGSWAARMSPALLRLPARVVRPIRGQMLALQMPLLTRLRHVVRTPRVYLVPRRDGRLIVGATVEDVGYEKQVTAGGVLALLAGATAAAPSLAQAALVETWAGLRPLAADDLPLIGGTDIEGLLCATGHYRNGILLTPITAEIVRCLVRGLPPPCDIAPFSPKRFYAPDVLCSSN
ncbi:MAG: glycine oxidase ThiO [Chloracidobacterium sp.]|nr:glycine oxidase ThiO [Chloracidobacterium sp.]MDW8217903.1 glycine oxidase ThiO [Acidobacteriota bacterium]